MFSVVVPVGVFKHDAIIYVDYFGCSNKVLILLISYLQWGPKVSTCLCLDDC